MRFTQIPITLGLALVMAACASQPVQPPTVANAQLSERSISPGDTLGVSFDLEVGDAAAVERIYVRGLPKNSLLAGTATDLPLPAASSSAYAHDIVVQKPAADGEYNLEVVVEMAGLSYVAPLGALAVEDTPSRILHAQFDRGSHAVNDCYGETRLLELEYTVEDDNGAADFVAPAVAATSSDSESLVFFPRWEPIAWMDGQAGIRLNQPAKDTVDKEVVSSDIRIFCNVQTSSLYEFTVRGQNVSRLDGKSTQIESVPVRYYVE